MKLGLNFPKSKLPSTAILSKPNSTLKSNDFFIFEYVKFEISKSLRIYNPTFTSVCQPPTHFRDYVSVGIGSFNTSSCRVLIDVYKKQVEANEWNSRFTRTKCTRGFICLCDHEALAGLNKFRRVTENDAKWGINSVLAEFSKCI